VILQVFKVRDASLAPEFQDGDFVVVSAIPIFFRRLRRGDVVVFQQPAYGRLIKRIERLEPCGALFVMGSGAGSVDSRTFGPVAPHSVQGLVLCHIPRRSAGRGGVLPPG
jgi:signal peptidase I